MIANDTELAITKEAVVSFEKALELMETDPAHQSLSAFKQQIYRQAMEGEVYILNEQIKAYQINNIATSTIGRDGGLAG